VDELLAECLLHGGMLLGVHEHHTVLIEQALITFDRDHEVALVLEGQPGAAIGQQIGVGSGRHVESRPHPLAYILVPRTLLDLDVETRNIPKVQLCLMRARTIAARNKRSLLVPDRFECRHNVLRPLYARRVGLRSNENEVVVHYGIALHSLAFGEELFLLGLCMDEYHVCIATSSGVERLAGALCDNFDIDTSLGLE